MIETFWCQQENWLAETSALLPAAVETRTKYDPAIIDGKAAEICVDPVTVKLEAGKTTLSIRLVLDEDTASTERTFPKPAPLIEADGAPEQPPLTVTPATVGGMAPNAHDKIVRP